MIGVPCTLRGGCLHSEVVGTMHRRLLMREQDTYLHLTALAWEMGALACTWMDNWPA